MLGCVKAGRGESVFFQGYIYIYICMFRAPPQGHSVSSSEGDSDGEEDDGMRCSLCGADRAMEDAAPSARLFGLMAVEWAA